MQKEERKQQDSTLFEGMTSLRALIDGIRKNGNTRRILKVLYDADRLTKNYKNIGYLKAVSKELGFSVEETDAATLEKMTLGTSHGGIVALTSERPLPCLSDAADLSENGFYVMIQGIEDPYNFGYALRSLYAMGCDGVVIPERNWMSAAGVVARSSAGASELLPMFTSDALLAADLFKSRGYRIVCADERTEHVLGRCELKLPLLLIVGGEKRGISKALVEKSDLLVRIDYGRDFHASLSAASATTIFAYEIARQNPNRAVPTVSSPSDAGAPLNP